MSGTRGSAVRPVRRHALAVLAAVGALAAGAALSACGQGTGTANNGAPATASPSAAGGNGQVGTGTTQPSSTATTGTTATTTQAAAQGLTCAQLTSAKVGGTGVAYNGSTAAVPLVGGTATLADGGVVTLQAPCGIGDLTGDGVADALGAVVLNGGGTGRFWSLVAWRSVGGVPVCAAVKDLDDRTPVTSITIAGNKATVVYETRKPTDSMAVLTIVRTVIFGLSGTTLVEVSHTDVPK